jgi:hypothetical protein
MSDPAGKPPRWEWVPMDVSMPLPETKVIHSSEVSQTFNLANDAGEKIAMAVASVDVRRRLVTIRELRYDANRITEAQARQALERFLAPAAVEPEAEVADEATSEVADA